MPKSFEVVSIPRSFSLQNSHPHHRFHKGNELSDDDDYFVVMITSFKDFVVALTKSMKFKLFQASLC